MHRRNGLVLLFIALLIGLSAVAVARPNIRLGSFSREGIKLGLDLRGGTHLVYQADFTGVAEGDKGAKMDEAMFNIERRVNAFGVSEPVLQRQGEDRIVVELPGVRDVKQAISLIGTTARLEFREQRTGAGGQEEWAPAVGILNGQEKVLTGEFLKSSRVEVDAQGKSVVAFQWDGDGAVLFEQVTTRLLKKPLGIFLDEEMISAPIVQAVIKESGIIEGVPLEEAKVLAIQLNAGRLPVPLKLIQQEDVDAFLGKDSLAKSILAGEIGLGMVLLFMVIYYRVPGAVASLALLVYGLLVLATFKLLPVTLTLPGVAGFILSVGMAVDANVLIFERMKEELMAGRTLRAAIGAGFNRAWPSIRDSNVSTFITCGILYWFGSASGETSIMGFALTLAIGVAASMFTAIVVTRAFLGPVLGSPLANRLGLFTIIGPKRREA